MSFNRSSLLRLTAVVALLAATLACGSSKATSTPEVVIPEATADSSVGSTDGSGGTGGSTGGGSTTVDAIDACAVLTAEDAQTALGTTVDTTPDTSQSTGNDFSCMWNSTDGQQYVQVLIHAMGTADAAAEKYNGLKALAVDPSNPVPDVTGVGEEAVYDPVFHWLIVRQGTNVFVFNAKLTSEDAIQSTLTGIAPTALARLK